MATLFCPKLVSAALYGENGPYIPADCLGSLDELIIAVRETQEAATRAGYAFMGKKVMLNKEGISTAAEKLM
jgi:hypothetical protein